MDAIDEFSKVNKNAKKTLEEKEILETFGNEHD